MNLLSTKDIFSAKKYDSSHSQGSQRASGGLGGEYRFIYSWENDWKRLDLPAGCGKLLSSPET
jgi:hypothetical protein